MPRRRLTLSLSFRYERCVPVKLIDGEAFSGGIMAKERIRVRLRGFDVELIDQSAKSIVQTVQKAGAKVTGPIPLPTRINKVTVLRSPHVNKKAREQFEMRTHKRLIDIISPSAEVMDSLMKLELPAGVDVEIKQ